MYSKEHTEAGHSEYQDEMLKKFQENNIFTDCIVVGELYFTMFTNQVTSVSQLLPDTEDDAKVCENMNEFMQRAHYVFFGTEFDGSDEPE